MLFLVLAGAPAAWATHLVGGELDLQHREGNTYQLTLNLYFDALNGNAGALDNELTASIFDRATNARVLDLELPLTSNTFVSYTNPACTSPTLVTRRLVYTRSVVLLPQNFGSAGGYYVAVERCCRNVSISNIQAPGDAAQTFYLEFPAVVRGGQAFRNSTPHRFAPLGDYACLNEQFTYPFGGQDADGDSLVYELTTPLNGHASVSVPKPMVASPAPYEPIRWNPGLSVSRQIPGSPTLTIDRRTGQLQVRPTQLGLFVFGIRCVEYRRGVKLGEVRRDFQLKVVQCPVNARPKVLLGMPGRAAPYQVGRDTLRLRPGAPRCFRLRFTDADPSSALSLSLRPVNFTAPLPTLSVLQGTVRGPGTPDTLVSELCFPACFNTRGRVYLLDLIVADNGCPLPKRDTVRVAFTAQPDPNGPPTLRTTAAQPLLARPGDLITFDLAAIDPDNDPVQLEMTGRGFAPASLGAQLTQAQSGNQRTGRFTWRVDCRAVDRPVYEFEFAAVTTPCNERTVATVVVPVQIVYENRPPALTSTLPPATGTAPVVIRRALGEVYEATLTGLDLDNDALALTAAGQGFELGAVGMSFVPRNGAGQASGTFRWEASCAAVAGSGSGNGLEVTFQLQETTCRPQPQTRTVRFEVISPDTTTFLPPNIITPRQRDNKNDFFELDNVQAKLPPDFCNSRFAGVKIFSRWGSLVYQSGNRSFRWDGGGRPAGVYYYLVEFTDKRRYKGTVTIAE
ncbi:gliding motility-associated C-terminal domain-containing protein [Hymenobacter weizhouensis]|uniref:gliding motility-associated C-terminal domain-containing protein n=1 Tax=Hymenobacter sp. YIM 151500-1 TaxID=2987689 RepID=UPI00222677B3|nr:gliding motility-associated C-terminal domain-containing protein [Hymenobacter sp. YIM 151500-1]UYZ64223.1 gliding motility-associated C-terminal domain-containing protein [Hymenobacter sp. YIM 151500-1]